jgi:hypothetical protein
MHSRARCMAACQEIIRARASAAQGRVGAARAGADPAQPDAARTDPAQASAARVGGRRPADRLQDAGRDGDGARSQEGSASAS